MSSFLKKVSLFILPLILVLGMPTFILYKSGESFKSVKQVAPSLNSTSLVGYAYNQANGTGIKYELLQTNDAEILALGSSRVLEFREEMFNASFYNSGWTIRGIKEFKPYLASLPKQALPKILIIGLDHNFFNPDWDRLEREVDTNYWRNSFSEYPDYTIYLKIYNDLFKGKYGLDHFLKSPNYNAIGLNAFIKGNGFRVDGSMYYKTEIEDLLALASFDPRFVFRGGLIEMNAKNANSYMGGDVVNIEALNELSELLAFCMEMDIYVIGFLPPWAEVVYAEMLARGNHRYLESLSSDIGNRFAKTPFEFYNFSHPSLVGSSDEEMIDGQHGSEVTYARILLKMIEKGSELNNHLDTAQLKRDLINKLNRYTIYPYGN